MVVGSVSLGWGRWHWRVATYQDAGIMAELGQWGSLGVQAVPGGPEK